MRRAAVVVSVLAHVLLFAALARTPAVVKPRVEAAPPPAVALVEPAPVEVVLVDPGPGVANGGGGGRASTTHAAAAPAIRAPGVEVPGVERPAPPAAVDLTLHAPEVRAPALPGISGTAGLTTDPIQNRVHGEATAPRIESQPGGRGVVHDTVTTMSVAPDGSVRLTDKGDVTAKLSLPVPPSVEAIRHGLGDALSDWYRDPYAGTRFGPTSELSNVALAVPGGCDTWGAPGCDDPNAPKLEREIREQKRITGGLGVGVTGNLDVTSWLHRKLIGDPYASRKRKLLDDTREARAATGEQFRTEQLARSAELMTRTLHQLWASERDPPRRREALFELWDDCEEGDGSRGEAGERARAVVIGWIRAHLPAGSPGAFTDEEVRALGARRASKQPFTPY